MTRLWFETLIQLLYPVECAFCKQTLQAGEAVICLECFKGLDQKKNIRIQERKDHKLEFLDRTCGIFLYEGQIKELLTEFKFSHKPWLVKLFFPFIKDAADALNETGYDLMAPIPISLLKSIARQFNQAEVICRELQSLVKARLDPHLLTKKWGVPAQSSLRKEERLANLYGAFKISPFRIPQDKSILLVDDIFTTGATSDEAARILKKCGARRVDLLTLAYTKLEKQKEAIGEGS